MTDEKSKSEHLNQLLDNLLSEDAALRLAAIATLAGLEYSSAAILRRLEVLALDDPSAEIRQAANNLLDTAIYRHIQFRLSRLSAGQRTQIITEINAWVEQGLLDPQRANVISRRYDFDKRKSPAAAPPIAPAPAQKPAEIRAAEPAPEPLAQAPQPRPNLLQTLTSETSTKVWLYLGAFFVIAAALILAALVEVLRTPILLGVTALFGMGALTLKQRLPQPSFTLWVVASSLALITARVVSDSLSLRAPWDAAYWLMVLSLFAGVWYISARIYQSRFFTLAMSAAALAAAWQLGRFFSPDDRVHAFTALAALPLLLLVGRHLIGWRDRRFAEPMLIALSLTALVGLLYYGMQTIILATEVYRPQPWLAVTGTGIALFIAFALINSLLPLTFPLWLLAGALALFPLGWLSTHAASIPLTGTFAAARTAALGMGIWGAMLSIAGEGLSTSTRTAARQYAMPLLLTAIGNFVTSLFLDMDNTGLVLGLSAGAGVLLTVLTTRNLRWWVWSAAIFTWTTAYITLWQLPALQTLKIPVLYQLAGLCALIALADWARPGDFRSTPGWRWPLRVFFALGVILTVVFAFGVGLEESISPSITFAILGLIFLAYALRFDRPYLGIGFTFFTWAFINTDIIPLRYVLLTTILAAVYYVIGFYLPRPEERFGWPRLFRWSGLAVGALTTLAVLFDAPQPYDGTLALIAAGLFLVESCKFIRWMELPAYLLMALGVHMLVIRNSLDWQYTLLGVTVLPAWLDFAYTRLTTHARPWRTMILAFAGFFALISAFATFQAAPLTALIISLVTALTLLGMALLYREPRLGYAYFVFLALVIFNILRLANIAQWSSTLIALAVLIYALSWLDKPAGWASVRRNSGLALGTLTALSVLLENSGIAGSIPAAIAAALWTVEAFRRRNVWLGFPANALYLMAYFIILIELKVDQPQFFSVGAAILGMLMHYLLMRTGSNTGAFITGMVSQLVLLSTTYLQMVATNSLAYFAALFFQSLAVLTYGLIIRSRSLVFTPIVFVVLGVITVVFSVLKGIATVILIGCTGILFILLGIAAVLMRERISEWRGRLNDWKA